jgi:phosphoribosyl-AMP cyclohydrolase
MSLPPGPIITERLRLEPVAAEAASEVYPVVAGSREHIARWMDWAASATEDTVRAVYAHIEELTAAGQAYSFLLRPRAGEGEVLGAVDIRLDPLGGVGEIGFWVRAEAAGQGYAAEAAAAVRDLGFDQLAAHRVELRAGVGNVASWRVAEKIGMRREGVLRASARSAEGDYDCFIYGILRDDPRRDTGERRVAGGMDPAAAAPDFARGLVTAVVQDEATAEVLMVAHMDEEAYLRTLETGHGWFWSRSRERLWEKGETSGDYLDVRSVTLDCDGDAVLLRVSPHGPACHTGARTCFHNPVRAR